MTPGAREAAAELTCTACGYDLRMLPSSGACPECGQPIAVSLDDLAISRPRWLRSMSVGSTLIGIGILTGGAGVWLRFGHRAMWPEWDALWLLPVGAVISASGTWCFAAPTPRVAGAQGRSLATVLRVAGIATGTLQLQLCVMLIAAFRGALRLDAAVLAFCTRAMLLVWGAAAAMTCLRAAFVAAQVSDYPGVVQARVLALLAPLTLLFFAAATNDILAGQLSRSGIIASAIGACVVAGWSAVFFSAFALVVRRRAQVH